MNENIFNTIDSILQNEGHCKALQYLLASPEKTYEDFQSKHPSFPFLVNYLDSCAFSNHIHFMLANRRLRESLYQFKEAGPFIEMLQKEFQTGCREKPKEDEKVFEQKAWLSFKQKYPKFASLVFSSASLNPTPHSCFHYKDKHPYNFKQASLCFVEPYKSGWNLLESRPAVLVFESKTIFLQMFQFAEFAKALDPSLHLIYLLDLHPTEQIEAQNFSFNQHLLAQARAPIKDLLALFGTTLENVIKSGLDSTIANKLYALSYEMSFLLAKQRLSPSRVPALILRESVRSWHEPHKVTPCEAYHFEEAALFVGNKIKLPKRKATPPYHIAHIVPQIVDEGHAPTKLLNSLVMNHSKDSFKVSVISTELFAFRKDEYPYNLRVSESSWKRAPDKLSTFIDNKIAVHICSDDETLISSVESISDYLHKNSVDIAVFHGPDLLNSAIAQSCDVPLKVFFDHGTLPSFTPFDLLVLSTPDIPQEQIDVWNEKNIDFFTLPFVVNARSGWLEKAEELKIPPNSFVMTTISNHLESRLSKQMVDAIAEILKRCPNAYYMPMGPIKDPSSLEKIFKEIGVEKRVKFLGSCSEPSQLARSMHLYLNEFPFGSGLGILDAMAAGCPVVSMYDPKGPPQARYGGLYFGVDKAIKGGDLAAYIDLACQLYQDKEMYDSWSKQALIAYEKHSDIASYMHTFESKLLEAASKNRDKQ